MKTWGELETEHRAYWRRETSTLPGRLRLAWRIVGPIWTPAACCVILAAWGWYSVWSWLAAGLALALVALGWHYALDAGLQGRVE